MDIIFMKSGAYRELMDRIDAIEKYVKGTADVPTHVGDGIWLNNREACACLKVSRRTLQRYRSNRSLAYSIIGNRAYYKLTEIQRIMEGSRTHRGGDAVSEPSEKE